MPWSVNRQFISNICQIFFAELIAVAIACLPCFLVPYGVPTTFTAAFTNGASVYLGLWVSFPVSEGHINPMMTIAFLLTRRLHPGYVPLYLVAQFTGAISVMAFGLAVSPFGHLAPRTYGLTLPSTGVSDVAAVFTEAASTFTFVAVHLASLDELRETTWGIENGNHFPFVVMLVVIVNSALTVSKLLEAWCN